MATIALKVDVDTLRGTQEGVPRLLALLQRKGIAATFLFSLGPDHTGWAVRRALRPGFMSKVGRTSVLSHYGLRTLLYGTLLPGPDIGRRAAAPMRAARDAGHECGIHTWDHVRWQDNVRRRDAAWTRRQMGLAFDRFTDIFGQPPATHGAAGWQMNAAAFEQIDDWGLKYASDGRGSEPFRPIVAGRTSGHVQLPTTLPTFDELVGIDGHDERDAVTSLLQATAQPRDQVFTLHAELEGQKLLAPFTQLLDGWRAQGYAIGNLALLYRGLDTTRVPPRRVSWGSVAGRSGTLVSSDASPAAPSDVACQWI